MRSPCCLASLPQAKRKEIFYICCFKIYGKFFNIFTVKMLKMYNVFRVLRFFFIHCGYVSSVWCFTYRIYKMWKCNCEYSLGKLIASQKLTYKTVCDLGRVFSLECISPLWFFSGICQFWLFFVRVKWILDENQKWI